MSLTLSASRMHPDDRSTRTERFIAAEAGAVFAAFIDPDELLKWLPPAGMTARLHSFDARAGGGYEMSLFYSESEAPTSGKSAQGEDRVSVRFVEIDPPRLIRETVRFISDDPAFAGEMTLEITVTPAVGGSRVCMSFRNLPRGLEPAGNELGARTSLAQLARLLEQPRPDPSA